jgi:uncharacterized protein
MPMRLPALAAGLLLCLAVARTARAEDLARGAFVGVAANPVGDELRQKLALPAGAGVLVGKVIPGGSAEAAGLRAGDVLLRIGDRPVGSPEDFVQSVKALRAGQTVSVRYVRDGKEAAVDVRLRPRPVERAPDVDTSYGAVRVDGSLRRTIVTRPRMPGRHPALLYVTGIGCFSQESLDLGSPDAKLLYGLTRAGLVTMRVEKSGMGDSQGPPCASDAVDLRAEVRGYAAGLAALSREPFVDPKKIFVVGLSIGGVEAPLLAQGYVVKGIVVVNTVAKPLFEYLLDTRRRQALLSHTPVVELEQRRRLDELCNHRLLIERQSPAEVLKGERRCAEFIEYPAPATYMQEWAALDLAAEWQKVRAPVLIVYGTSDFVSSIEDNPYLAQIINEAHANQASLEAIPGMDHYLTRAASMEESIGRPPGGGEFVPEVVETIGAWIAARARE